MHTTLKELSIVPSKWAAHPILYLTLNVFKQLMSLTGDQIPPNFATLISVYCIDGLVKFSYSKT